MYGPNDEHCWPEYGTFLDLDDEREYDPDEEWDPDFYQSEPDPDDARDRMIEDDRWDGVS